MKFIPSRHLVNKFLLKNGFIFLMHLLIPFMEILLCQINYFLQRSVATTSRRSTIRFSDLKRKRYWFPLMVDGFVLNFITSLMFFCIIEF